jgi:hypothetical protein
MRTGQLLTITEHLEYLNGIAQGSYCRPIDSRFPECTTEPALKVSSFGRGCGAG